MNIYVTDSFISAAILIQRDVQFENIRLQREKII